MLQKNAGRPGETSPPLPTTRLILNDNFTAAAIEIVKDAKTEIRLMAYAWRWYQDEPEIGIQMLNVELLRARQRGVNVMALVDTDAIRERVRALGLSARSVAGNKMQHSKVLCVDHTSLALGSHNLTKRANTDNYEVSVIIQEFEPIDQFITYFDAMWRSRG